MICACNKVRLVAALLALLVFPSCMIQEVAQPGIRSDALKERERVMAQLAADSKRALERLKGLTDEQKNAVVALMTIARASAAYESRFLRRDDPALRALYGPLSQFSPAYRAPANFHRSLMVSCLDETVSCLRAQKECLDDGGTVDACERRASVIQACAGEMICFTNEFMKLHKGFPAILGGRDPWPPQPNPFPY